MPTDHRSPITDHRQPLRTVCDNVSPHAGEIEHPAYLIENRFIEDLKVTDPNLLSIFARDVLAMIQSGRAGWEELVPERVASLIKERKLLRYQDPS